MKHRGLFPLVIAALFLATSAVVASDVGNTSQGTLTVNQDTYQLDHAYVYAQDDEVVVVLLDNPVPQDKVPWDIGDMAYDQDLHGLSVGISKSTRQVNPDSMFNAVYHTVWLGRGALLNTGKLTVDKLDDSVLEGRLTMEKPDAIFDHTYSFDVGFKVSFGGGGQKPQEVVVNGDDTPAGKAYASYYRAKLAGDLETVRGMVVKENVKDLEGEMGKVMIEMSMMSDPREITIVETAASAGSADLTVKGTTADNGSATGRVKMVVEDGQWKVSVDKWVLSH